MNWLCFLFDHKGNVYFESNCTRCGECRHYTKRAVSSHPEDNRILWWCHDCNKEWFEDKQ